MKARSILALGAAVVGLAASNMMAAMPVPVIAPPQPFSSSPRYRSRWPGKRQPAGSKLARKARSGSVGVARIR